MPKEKSTTTRKPKAKASEGKKKKGIYLVHLHCNPNHVQHV